jgi:thiol-disulfide isomerase/thioredoxin
MIRSLFLVLVTTVVLLVGCSSTPELGPSAAAAPDNGSVPSELQFTAQTLAGENFSGDSLLGEPAVLWFWAPWCPVCQREAPMVGTVAQANPAVRFVGVAAQDEVSAMQEFVDTYPVGGFTHLADTDGAVWARFGVTYQPAYAFVDPAGGINVVKASLSEAELNERVSALSAR